MAALRAPIPLPTHTLEPRSGSRRALVWDVWNSSSVIAARSLVAAGWTVDAIVPAGAPWRDAPVFNGARIAVEGNDDPAVEAALFDHPLDALFLHGDDQVRWLLARWDRLPQRLTRHLAPRESLQTALSKRLSMNLARDLGLPILPTATCTSEEELRTILESFPADERVVVKGEGGSAGRAVRALKADPRRAPALWAELSAPEGRVLVQRRLNGPRLLATVVYERGVQRAACQHIKSVAFPYEFGVTARGVTTRVPEVAGYAEKLFGALEWHGVANVEFRQDVRDGRWYFMEINPRVPSSIGIQKAAGVDVAGVWADVCLGEGARHRDAPAYREGVSYAWAVPMLAVALRRPYLLPLAVHGALRSSDLRALDPRSALRAIKVAAWRAVFG